MNNQRNQQFDNQKSNQDQKKQNPNREQTGQPAQATLQRDDQQMDETNRQGEMNTDDSRL